MRRLEREPEVELAVERERLRQVARDKPLPRDAELRAIDVVAVDADDVLDAVLAAGACLNMTRSG